MDIEITEKQEDLFYHNCLRRWMDNILTTRPINCEEVEKAIQFAYEVANLPCPKYILFLAQDNNSLS